METVEVLLFYGADVTALGESFLSPLIRDNCSVELVESFLEHGLKVNIEVDPPLLAAIDRRNQKMVEFLLKRAANINIRSGEALTRAITLSDYELTKLLVTRGAKISGDHGQLA